MDANIVCNALEEFRQNIEPILPRMRRFCTASAEAFYKGSLWLLHDMQPFRSTAGIQCRAT